MLFKQKENSSSEKNKMIFFGMLAEQKKSADECMGLCIQCVSEPLREDMLNILREEISICFTMTDELMSRGWQKERTADSDEKSAAQRKYNEMKNTL